MISLIFRLYVWVSIAGGLFCGVSADDMGLFELISSLAWNVLPSSLASSWFGGLLVLPAAVAAWLVPASTDAMRMLMSALGWAAGAAFLLASAVTLIYIGLRPGALLFGIRGSFDNDR